MRTPELLQTIPSWLGSKCQVVGDLFADAVALSEQCALRESNATSEQRSLDAKNPPGVKVLGLLPGSKVCDMFELVLVMNLVGTDCNYQTATRL